VTAVFRGALTPLNGLQGGHTLLHFAAGFGHAGVTELLLRRGAALELRDKARQQAQATPHASSSPAPRQWGKAPVDWARQAGADACVALLRAEGIARGVASGRGAAAPLATVVEHFHGCTDDEMEARLVEATAAAAARKADADAREALADTQPYDRVTETRVGRVGGGSALLARLEAANGGARLGPGLALRG